MRILLVEDDISLANGLRTAFRREGFTTNHVTSGHEALEAIRTDATELVILDLGLPDMDGLEVQDPVLPVPQTQEPAAGDGTDGA